MAKTAAVKKTPMSNTMRTVIVSKMLNGVATERREAIHKERMHLFHKAIQAAGGRNIFARMAKMPEGWMPMTDRLDIRRSDGTYHGALWLRRDSKVMVPYSFMSNGLLVQDDVLFQQIMDNKEAESNLSRDLAVMNRELLKALKQFRTLEALKEQWPEAYKALPEEYHTTPNLPAVPVETVKRLLAAFQKGQTVTKDNGLLKEAAE